MGGVHSRDPLGTRIMRSRSNDLNEGFGLMGLELETPIRSLALDRGADGWILESSCVGDPSGTERGMEVQLTATPTSPSLEITTTTPAKLVW